MQVVSHWLRETTSFCQKQGRPVCLPGRLCVGGHIMSKSVWRIHYGYGAVLNLAQLMRLTCTEDVVFTESTCQCPV